MLRAIGFLLLGLAVLAGPAEAKRVALVVGNDSYASLPSLNNAVRDARDMAAKLKSLGFEVVLRTNAGRRDLGRALADFEGQLAGAEAGLVFYAGHGIQSDGVNYLVPSDAKVEVEDDLRYEAVDSNDFLKAMQRAGAPVNVVILDACRDNPLPKRSRSASRGLGVVEVPTGVKGIVRMYSAGPGETAADGGRGGNGVFTGELLKALDAPGLTIEKVFKETALRVSQATRGKQTPWISASLTGDFYFKAGSPAPVVTDGGGGSGGGSSQAELMFWQSIQASKDAGDYEAYLSQYPNGSFAPLARKRAEDLKGTKVATLVPPRSDVALDALDREMVAGRKGNMREAPEAKAKLVSSIAEGETVQVTGKVKGENWFAVTRKGQSGYLVADILEEPAAYKARKEKEAQVAALSPPAPKAGSGSRSPGTVFRDCSDCPEMVVVPAGSFTMGSPSSDEGRYGDEVPQHSVTIGYSFAVGKYEVTQAEWQAVMGNNPSALQGARNPVEKVSWKDAQEFIRRLNAKVRGAQTVSTGGDGPYRLLTEAEWEYAARAGTTTRYSWGDSPGSGNANCDGCGSSWDTRMTAPVGSFRPNAFGLYDMHGNVWEWVQDCAKVNYDAASSDGSAVDGQCANNHVNRGGSWHDLPRGLRSAARSNGSLDYRVTNGGIRLARALH